MKKTSLTVLFILVSAMAHADVRATMRISTGKLIEAQSAAPEGALLQQAINKGIPANDVHEVILTDAQFQRALDDLYAPDLAVARAKRLEEIRNQAMSLYSQYALYSGIQAVIDYGAALRAVPTTAQAEMSALPDVASVKNYQPAWPAKPRLQ